MMQTTLVIATCVKQKQHGRHKAKDLYNSVLFKKMRQYIESKGYDWRIISAKHGLVDPETIIDYYEEDSFNQFKSHDKIKLSVKKLLLSEKIRKQIAPIITNYDTIVLMCGKHYRDVIIPLLNKTSAIKQIITFFEDTQGIGEILKKLRRG